MPGPRHSPGQQVDVQVGVLTVAKGLVPAGLTTMVYTAYGGLFISILTDQVQGGFLDRLVNAAGRAGWPCCSAAATPVHALPPPVRGHIPRLGLWSWSAQTGMGTTACDCSLPCIHLVSCCHPSISAGIAVSLLFSICVIYVAADFRYPLPTPFPSDCCDIAAGECPAGESHRQLLHASGRHAALLYWCCGMRWAPTFGGWLPFSCPGCILHSCLCL